MSRSLNKCMFIGNLGDFPENAFMPNAVQVTKFSIAVANDYLVDGEKTLGTDWIPCVLFNGLAENAKKQLKKGYQVYVEGRFKTRSYTKKHSEIVRYVTEIIVSDYQILNSRGDSVADDETRIPFEG